MMNVPLIQHPTEYKSKSSINVHKVYNECSSQYGLAARLAGWEAGWLAGRLTRRLVGWLEGRLVGWLAGSLAGYAV